MSARKVVLSWDIEVGNYFLHTFLSFLGHGQVDTSTTCTMLFPLPVNGPLLSLGNTTPCSWIVISRWWVSVFTWWKGETITGMAWEARPSARAAVVTISCMDGELYDVVMFFPTRVSQLFMSKYSLPASLQLSSLLSVCLSAHPSVIEPSITSYHGTAVNIFTLSM